MILLLRCDHLIHAAHLAGVLRAAGIRCDVRNTTLSGALGEIPWQECAPQLWVDERDESRARALVENLRAPPQGTAWTCQSCGERLDPQFGQCWNCGAEKPLPA